MDAGRGLDRERRGARQVGRQVKIRRRPEPGRLGGRAEDDDEGAPGAGLGEPGRVVLFGAGEAAVDKDVRRGERSWF
jgi:hypothetical protein